MQNDKPLLQSTIASNAVLVPGAREERKPIIANITKHDRKHSLDTKNIANYDQSVQANDPSIGLNSGRDNYLAQIPTTQALQNSQSRMSGNLSQGTLPGGLASQTVLGLQGKEQMTFRGQLEALEQVLIDVVSEIKYHRR